MRVAGIRQDGVMWLSLDGGMSVLFSEDRCSPPVDPAECEGMGPWLHAHGISGQDRRELVKRLDAARTVPLAAFLLGSSKSVRKKFKFEYETSDDDNVFGDKPDDDKTKAIAVAPAEGDGETPKPEAAAKPEGEGAPAGAAVAVAKPNPFAKTDAAPAVKANPFAPKDDAAPKANPFAKKELDDAFGGKKAPPFGSQKADEKSNPFGD